MKREKIIYFRKIGILCTFLLVFFTSTAYSQTGWFMQSPYPQSGHIISSKFFDLNTGYACANWRNFIKTTNGGINWTIHNYGTTQAFDMDFVDVNTGYIVGVNGICYKTTNRGINWSNLSLGTGNNLNAIKFIGDVGYIFSSGTAFFKSTDRGNTWILNNVDTTIGFVKACFINANTGHVIARDPQANTKELITTNGGENWYIQQLATSEPAFSIYFADDNTGYIAGGYIYSKIQKTTNGGTNWFVQFPPGSSLQDIMFINSETGYASGWDCTIIKTTNGGISWTQFTINDDNTLLSVSVIDADNCYAMGAYGNIFKTINGGTNWMNLFSGTVEDLNGMYFVNPNTGYAVGYGVHFDGVVKTTNGGQYWFRQNIPTSAPLTANYFINPDSGYAVGYNGAIIKTTNGGLNWVDLFQPLGSFYDVKFINFDTGYIISDVNIYKTTNGGLNWEEKDNRGGKSIFFVNSETGYASGTEFVNGILKTTNSGENWVMHSIPTSKEIKSIYFLNNNTGYAAGGDLGVILKTTNGGNNWNIAFESSNYLPFKSVYFTNINTGYAVADYSNNVMKTTNGGSNWYNQNTGLTGTTNGFYCVQFLNDSVGYIVGNDGFILKTRTGGEPIGIVNISSEIPSSFMLHQNYPNPFNPSTKIKFDIPSTPLSFGEGQGLGSDKVRLVIYDILGREIQTLINQEMKPGTYEVEFSAVNGGINLASGLYFYRLEVMQTGASAAYYSETKKMVLLK